MTDTSTAQTAHLTAPGDVRALRDSFELSLRAAHRARKTIVSYMESVDQWATFLAERGMPTDVAAVRREHVEAWLADLADQGRAAATLVNRYRGVKRFLAWCVE